MKITGPTLARKESHPRGEEVSAEGNARLTGSAALVLLVLFVIQIATVVMGVKSHLTSHVVVGLPLVPPLLVKMTSVLWRLAKHSRPDGAYRRKAVAGGATRIVLAARMMPTTRLVRDTAREGVVGRHDEGVGHQGAAPARLWATCCATPGPRRWSPWRCAVRRPAMGSVSRAL